MATATKNDDDLLIISDDSQSDDNSEITFSFDGLDDDTASEKTMEVADETQDSEIVLKEPEVETREGSSELDIAPIEVSEAVEPTTNEDASSDSFDLGIDVEEALTDTSHENIEKDISLEEKQDDFSLDLSPGETLSKETSEVTAEDTLSDTSGTSMNDILSATIAQLEARKNTISTEKAAKSTQEEELKKQIASLEKQVSELESEMTTLDMESDKIELNISDLEKMKLDPVKDHNAKRAKK